MAVHRPGRPGTTEVHGATSAERRSPWDGRVARGERTRSALVEATVELIRSGSPHPTAGQVAERAGVSVRLVFHHFGEVQALYERAAALQADRARSLIGLVPPRGPVGLRVRAICRQRRLLFETLGPEPGTAGADGHLDDPADELVNLLRRQLLVGLRPEILAAGDDAPVLFEALDSTTGWRNWTSLRRGGRRSAADAERVVVYTTTVLVAGTAGPPPERAPGPGAPSTTRP